MITPIEQKAINSLNWMLDKADDVYGDDTGYQFNGYMPAYTVQALHFYFKVHELSSTLDTRTIRYGDWNVTLMAGKFTSTQNQLTVCFNRNNEWHVKKELEAFGLLPNEATTLVERFAAKGKEAFEAFCNLVYGGLITPDSYSF